MSILLESIRNVDIVIYHFLNGFAGNRLLNYFASFEERDMLLKGGLLLALYWSLWFRPGSDRDSRRRAISAIVAGALFAVVACRVVADLGPHRIRPMYNPHLQHRAYLLPQSLNLVNWSAFPSDTAAYFFALAFGLARLSRRLAVPAMLYAAGWICLPRLFLGEHYASDVIAGALVGIVRGDGLHLRIRVASVRPHYTFADVGRSKNQKIFYPAAHFSPHLRWA